MAIRIGYNWDTFDASTITSSSEASSDLADDNVVHDHVGKPWRTSSDNGEWIAFDLGGATQIKTVGIFNHNLSASATVTLEADSAATFDSDSGSPEYSQALTIATDADGNPHKRIVYFLDQTYRYWRISISDYPTNTDGYIQIGRIVMGTYYEPDRNMREGFSVAMADPSEGQNKPGTHTFWRTKTRFRRATVAFEYMGRTQKDKLEAIFLKAGNSEPLLLALDPSAYPSEDSMYCYLVTPLSLANQLVDQYGTAQLVFEEKTE